MIGLVITWEKDTQNIGSFFPEYTVYICSAKSSKRGERNMDGLAVLVKSTFSNFIKQLN